jgi:hypothetical protein
LHEDELGKLVVLRINREFINPFAVLESGIPD